TGTLWFVIFLTTWVIARFAGQYFIARDLWVTVTWGLIPAIAIFKLLWLCNQPYWPLNKFRQNYLYSGLIPVCIYVALWIIYACFQEGNPDPLRYFPVVNPLDIAQLFSMVIIYEWLKDIKSGEIKNDYGLNLEVFFSLIVILAFIW